MADVKPIYLTAAGGLEEADPVTDTIDGPLMPPIVKTLNITPPENGDNELILWTPAAITITEIRAVLWGGGTSVALTGIYHAATRNEASPNEVITGTTFNSFTTGNVFTAFTDPTVPANSFIWAVLGTITGSILQCSIAMTYTID